MLSSDLQKLSVTGLVTLYELDGVISLKTYKRTFSMKTFTFAPDLN